MRSRLQRFKKQIVVRYSDRLKARPIFLVCPPRSGSSLLFEMLARTALFDRVPFETDDAWNGAFRNALGLPTDAPLPDSTLKEGWSDVPRFREQLVANLLDQIHPGQPCLADRGGIPYLEKTIANSLRMDRVLELFPEAQFVFIKRDPREVISSMLEGWPRADMFGKPELQAALEAISDRSIKHWSFPAPADWSSRVGRPLPEICAWSWRCHVEGILDFKADHPERVLDVEYEEFCRHPKTVLESILEYAKIDGGDSVDQIGAAGESRTTVSRPSEAKWRRLHADAVASILPEIEATAARLGFDLSEGETAL